MPPNQSSRRYEWAEPKPRRLHRLDGEEFYGAHASFSANPACVDGLPVCGGCVCRLGTARRHFQRVQFLDRPASCRKTWSRGRARAAACLRALVLRCEIAADGAGRDAQGADHLLSAALSTVIHPVITMAAAKKSSKVNKGRTMPLNPSSMT